MYHFRSAHAAASSDAMSTVIDGADQAQYGLPYFAQDDKSTTTGFKYKVWFWCCDLCWPFFCGSTLSNYGAAFLFFRLACMLPWCMVSSQMLTSFLETCLLGRMQLWRLFTGMCAWRGPYLFEKNIYVYGHLVQSVQNTAGLH